MTDPQPKPLAEAREDREKLIADMRERLFGERGRTKPNVLDIAYTAFNRAKAKNDEDGGSTDWFTDTKPTVDAAVSFLRADFDVFAAALSASPAPETDALREALGRIRALFMPAKLTNDLSATGKEMMAIIEAALHTGGEGKGETAVQTPTAWMRDRDGGLRDYSLTQPSGEGWYPLYRKPQVIMRERMPFSFEPSSTPATATGETDLQWEIEKAFRLFYNLTVTPEAWTALSTLRHELQNLKHAKHPIGTREFFGRVVREAWIAWAQTQPNPKPTWLVPYDQLAEPDKEADRQIGEAVRARSQPPVPRAADAEGWKDRSK